MSPPLSTRRLAIFTLVAIFLLAVAGLGWATHSVVTLARKQAQEIVEKRQNERLRLAVLRMEVLVQPVLGRELARRFNDYRLWSCPSDARFTRGKMLVVRGEIETQSPLKLPSRAEWLLLHFMVSDTGAWSSPQVDEFVPNVRPEELPLPPKHGKDVQPYWLTALRACYEPGELGREFDRAYAMYLTIPRSHKEEMAEITEDSGKIDDSDVTRVVTHPGETGEADFARRGEQVRRLQFQGRPEEQELCEPEQVAPQNLSGSDVVLGGSVTCVKVDVSPMVPIWLELTPRRQLELAYVRSASPPGTCQYQGVLIDWDRLRELLELEVQDLFPGARVVPVRIDQRVPPEQLGSMMRTMPVRLEVPAISTMGASSVSASLKSGLWVAWIATLLAWGVICYGTMKSVTTAERRIRFASAVTHELRTPLTTFQLYTDLLADSMNGNGERQRQYVATLGTEARRLARLVENVLAYSRIGRQTPVLQRREIAATELLEAARQATEEACQAAGKELVIENRCANGCRVETDPEFVVQILSNLVDNACKYSAGAADARIWVRSVTGPGETVSFEVEDAGPGVAAEDRREVFQAFQRGRSEAARNVQGLGLGLALSRNWAGCLGGTLTLKRGSHNSAGYSCFALTLSASATAERRDRLAPR